MSFGGAPVAIPANALGGTPPPSGKIQKVQVQGGTLAPTIGAFATGAADCARLTTVNPAPAGTFQLPTNLGPGSGNWANYNAAAIDVELADLQAGGAAAMGNPRLVTKSIGAGDLTIDIQNTAPAPAVAVIVKVGVDHTIEL